MRNRAKYTQVLAKFKKKLNEVQNIQREFRDLDTLDEPILIDAR